MKVSDYEGSHLCILPVFQWDLPSCGCGRGFIYGSFQNAWIILKSCVIFPQALSHVATVIYS